MRYLEHKEINKDKWDECVRASPDGNIYCLSWYLDIVAPKWDGVVAMDGSSGYCLVMPVPHYRKFGIRYVRMPHFANQLGLVSSKPTSAGDLVKVLSFLKSRFDYILNYPMNLGNEELLNQLALDERLIASFSRLIHGSYEIDLNTPYQDLYAKFTSDRKKNIRKSLREKLTLVETTDIEPLIGIHKQFTAPRIYGGVTDHQYDLLRHLFVASHKRQLGSLFAIRHRNQTIGSCFFLFFKSSIIKFCNVSTTEGRHRNADSFMMHTLLQRWANQDKVFDFERASLAGINHYKESYGAKTLQYSSIEYNNLPGWVKAIRRLRVRLTTSRDQ